MSVLKLESESLTQNDELTTLGLEPEGLAQGDNLSREEFLRIWEQLPNLKRAELINGIVYMPSPLALDHGLMNKRLSYWLATYELATPICQNAGDVTWFMQKSAPQPDEFLRLLPEHGGQSRTEGKYPAGAPELAAEVASSSAAYDLHQKLELYLDAGVQEYLVVVLRKREIRWLRRVENRYQLLESDSSGVFRSLVFPGLWLNAPALLKDDMKAVLETLQEGLHSPEYAEFVAKLAARPK
jgi:Uma2 family endonuclease